MRRTILIIIAILLCSATVEARTKIQGWCEQGGQSVVVAGITSSTATRVQRSFPSCTVTVYLPGTTSAVTLYADQGGTAKANPFTASSTAQWFAYVDVPDVDVRFSGTGLSTYTIGNYISSPTAYLTGFGASCNGSANDAAAISTANTALATNGGDIVFPAGHTCVLGSSLTTSPKVNLVFQSGGILSVSSGATATITGSVSAPPQKIITGSGSIVLSGAIGPTVYPQWWGAIADGATDNAAAIQSAILAVAAKEGTVFFPAATSTYNFSTTLSLPSGVGLKGDSLRTSILRYTGAAVAVDNATPATRLNNWRIRDLGLLCNASCTIGLHVQNVSAGEFDSLQITDFDLGVKVVTPAQASAFSGYNRFYNVLVQGGINGWQVYGDYTVANSGANANLILGSRANGYTGIGFDIKNSNDVTIAYSQAEPTGGVGVGYKVQATAIGLSDGNRLVGNRSEGNLTDINIDTNSRFTTVDSNYFSGAGVITNASTSGTLINPVGNNQVNVPSYRFPGVTQLSPQVHVSTSGAAFRATSAGGMTLDTSVSVGAAAAASGAYRLENNASIVARRADNLADVSLLKLDGSNIVNLSGFAGSSILLNAAAADVDSRVCSAANCDLAWFDAALHTNEGAIGLNATPANGTFITATTPAGAARIEHFTNGTVTWAGYGAGTLTTDASGNITAVSDERLKRVVGRFTAGLSQIMRLRPILYKWLPQSHLEGEHTYAGFSAQNVASQIPEAVGVNPDGTLTLQDRALMAAMVVSIQELEQKNIRLMVFVVLFGAGLMIGLILLAIYSKGVRK